MLFNQKPLLLMLFGIAIYCYLNRPLNISTGNQFLTSVPNRDKTHLAVKLS